MEELTMKEVTEKVEKASTMYERTNTDEKRKFMLYQIEAFNLIALSIKCSKGSFGTGYPFYVLNEKLEGEIPIISEQIRYNRQLVRDGQPFQKSIWLCKSCLERNYNTMPDLKIKCKPCPNMKNELKPRKIINRLPDLDMWLVCADGHIEEAETELSAMLEKYNMRTSDVAPLQSLSDIVKIAKTLKKGEIPKVFLPIDTHIIEESTLMKLIEDVPKELHEAKIEDRIPYLPIMPKSLRKHWQYDDEAYNFIYDYLSAFTPFNFSNGMMQKLQDSRDKVIRENTPGKLFEFLINSATPANFRRFQEDELEKIFYQRVKGWYNRERKEEIEER